METCCAGVCIVLPLQPLGSNDSNSTGSSDELRWKKVPEVELRLSCAHPNLEAGANANGRFPRSLLPCFPSVWVNPLLLLFGFSSLFPFSSQRWHLISRLSLPLSHHEGSI